jgi:hypothetical protein
MDKGNMDPSDEQLKNLDIRTTSQDYGGGGVILINPKRRVVMKRAPKRDFRFHSMD